MAAIASNLINRKDKDYPQVPFGVWSIIPVEVQWGANAAADTATFTLPGKVLGVIADGCGRTVTQSAQSASIVLTAKAASLGTQLHLVLMEVGR